MWRRPAATLWWWVAVDTPLFSLPWMRRPPEDHVPSSKSMRVPTSKSAGFSGRIEIIGRSWAPGSWEYGPGTLVFGVKLCGFYTMQKQRRSWLWFNALWRQTWNKLTLSLEWNSAWSWFSGANWYSSRRLVPMKGFRFYGIGSYWWNGLSGQLLKQTSCKKECKISDWNWSTSRWTHKDGNQSFWHGLCGQWTHSKESSWISLWSSWNKLLPPW